MAFLPGALRSQVAEPVGPALSPTRTQKQNRAVRDATVGSLPPLQIRHIDPVVRSGTGRYVHDHGGSDQSVEWNLLGGQATTREVNGRVEMSSSVLPRSRCCTTWKK